MAFLVYQVGGLSGMCRFHDLFYCNTASLAQWLRLCALRMLWECRSTAPRIKHDISCTYALAHKQAYTTAQSCVETCTTLTVTYQQVGGRQGLHSALSYRHKQVTLALHRVVDCLCCRRSWGSPVGCLLLCSLRTKVGELIHWFGFTLFAARARSAAEEVLQSIKLYPVKALQATQSKARQGPYELSNMTTQNSMPLSPTNLRLP